MRVRCDHSLCVVCRLAGGGVGRCRRRRSARCSDAVHNRRLPAQVRHPFTASVFAPRTLHTDTDHTARQKKTNRFSFACISFNTRQKLVSFSFLHFLQILPTAAFLFFFRTDSTDSPDCSPILQSISFLLFSFFLFSTFNCWFCVVD